jgi:hypothetical protein
MTGLKRNALLRLPLSENTVESFYDGSRSGTAEQRLHALCESHERLRAELQGTELMMADLEAKLAKALALTDTGSTEFRQAFPPRSAGEAITPREIIAGWRVVEKIREILL